MNDQPPVPSPFIDPRQRSINASSPARVARLADQGREEDRSTVAERIAMMWPLALEAWAFAGEPVVEQRLPRHVERVIRGGR